MKNYYQSEFESVLTKLLKNDFIKENFVMKKVIFKDSFNVYFEPKKIKSVISKDFFEILCNYLSECSFHFFYIMINLEKKEKILQIWFSYDFNAFGKVR